MSNLFKPWSVQTASPDARVIDSNERMMEYLKKNGAYQGTPESSRGTLAEGSLPEGESNVIKAEPEVDHVALAKEQAKQILANANAQAEAIVVRARDEAESVEEAAERKDMPKGRSVWNRNLRRGRQSLRLLIRIRKRRLRRITVRGKRVWSARLWMRSCRCLTRYSMSSLQISEKSCFI